MEHNHKIHLTAKDILEKDFKTGMRGYDKDEVDRYLDIIIKDYELFQEEHTQLQQENQQLRKEKEKLHAQRQNQSSSVGNTNYDILKRLSNLERHVFGDRLNES